MDAQAKQQVIERVKQASNVLVTVSNSPSVDQLAACIGLTLLLNKVGKHTTAVFSGEVPSTVEFLQPEKTIQQNTDSLRDFIISLDKAKADKLRYKVEDQFVKIFITPYRTSINEKDLQFSLGEYNVEVILALGVSDQAQLDAALTAHGKILHDATVISLMAGKSKPSNLGQINWQDQASSSLSEMVTSMSESFGSNLIDGQMATALLTGIVAETDRFSNEKTSPKVMTMSAQLMAAGANQQLIVSKLAPPEVEQTVEKVDKPQPAAGKPKPKSDGVLSVKHEDKPKPPPLKVEGITDQPAVAAEQEKEDSTEIEIDREGNIKEKLPEETAAPAQTPALPPPATDTPAPETESKISSRKPMEEPPAQEDSSVEDTGTPSLPGSHNFLESKADQNKMDENYNAFADNVLKPDGILSHGPNVDPNAPPADDTSHEDRARNAVQQALAGAGDNPALDEFKSPNAADNEPQPEVVQPQAPAAPEVPETQESEAVPPPNDGPAPPLVPPPIMTPQGVPIPPPPREDQRPH